MKTPLLSTTVSTAPPRHRRPRRRAFSLVEVTLALGIVAFGLVGVVGVLPTALASGRQSFDQNRAAAIANTLFASFRSQPFGKVGYVDAQFQDDGATSSGNGPVPIDLSLPNGATASSVVFYAKILSLATDPGSAGDAFGTQRRLSFSVAPPTGGADYRVALNFYDAVTRTDPTTHAAIVVSPPSNQPDGMATAGQACRLELVVSPVSRPGDQYRFVSTVARRGN